MKSHLLAFFVLLSGITTAVSAMEPAPTPLKLGGSTQEWYQGAHDRNISNPVLLRYVYATRNNPTSLGDKIISWFPGKQKDYVYTVVGPQSFNLYDETHGAYFSMDPFLLADKKERPFIIFRAPNNQVYVLNFQKMSNYSPTTPLYNAVLEKIKNTGANQALRSPERSVVLQALAQYMNNSQLPRERVESLGHITPGEVLTVLADDQDVYLSKGNR